MVDDARSSRKAKDGEASGSTKKLNGGKNDSSGSVSGETSGLRRSARQSNASPVSARKSSRLENLTPTKSSSASAAKKVVNQTPTPLRRSGRENKFQSQASEKGSSSRGGSRQQKGVSTPDTSNKKEEQSVSESSQVGTKRKKRLDARRYREMFKVKSTEKKVKVSDSGKKASSENDDGSGDSGSEEDGEGQEECSDGEELKEGTKEDVDHDTRVSDSDMKEHVVEEKPCKSEDVESNVPSSCGPEATKNEAGDMETDCPVTEEMDNQENVGPSNKLSDDLKGTPWPPVSKSGGTRAKDVAPSVSSMCKMRFLTDPCARCCKRRRLGYDSPKQKLCCCLSNSVDNMNMLLASEDRGECGTAVTAQPAEKNGQIAQQSGPPLDVEQSTCVTCQHAGKLLHCGGKGCGRSYHPSCISTSEINLLLPIWYCFRCTEKKFVLGVHSVTEGIETIWDVREVESSESEGVGKQQQCFVKYKGLAHIHNHWVPEIEILNEVPELLSDCGEKNEETKWKTEWTVPHRLLQKRPFITGGRPGNRNDQNAGIVPNGLCEWLVKWCALDYDQATWELEDSSCFKMRDVQRLIIEYETRHDRARKTSLSKGSEIQERRKGSHVKLGRLLGGALSGADGCYLNSVSKLRDCHNKSRNAILLDEQDRVVKVIYLVSSLVTCVNRPFLIITSNESLSYWETEFLRVAASIDVVVYGGSANARKIIRSLEFYGEGGVMMLQVLLSTMDIVSEDLDVLKDIKWEAIIVDDCQESLVLEQSGVIKNLATDWRLLLVNAPLKDNVAEYNNILSLVESGGESNQNPGLSVDSREDIKVLKDRLSSFVVCARFLECWVPVQLSNLQLEQYCSLIMSNSSSLRSCSKSDPVGSLREILISLRKCCDHPYVVDASLQDSLTEDLPPPDRLNFGIRASGKLQLLNEILSDLRNKGLKVLILYQTIGSRGTTGIILEDFLRFQFGSETYEHVDSGGCISSKKQAALNKFNREKERSFFLLETRACFPSIKFTSLDVVIIFGSDWNPLSDVRALQKITIDSKLELIKVFRLYSSCTVEEKVLILAKKDMILDSTLQGISPGTNQMLLMWGSSYLFSKLEEFHCDNVPDLRENVVAKYSLLKDVFEEILCLVKNHETIASSKFISVARHRGGRYPCNTALIGEQEIHLEDGELPHAFWTKLLEGKQPQWKYLSGSTQRSRKRVQYMEPSQTASEVQADESAKKRKKTDSTKMDLSSQQYGGNQEKRNALNKDYQGLDSNKPASHSGPTLPIQANDIPGASDLRAESSGRQNLYIEQRGLLPVLKPAILSLCDILFLQDDGKRLAEKFLDYIVKNHRVNKEPETVLQAFQLSVCWAAAAMLNQEIDHKKSLATAREKLNFSCNEDEADFLFSKMKLLMRLFLNRSDASKIPNSSSDLLATNGNTRGLSQNGVILEESSLHSDCLNKQVQSQVQTTNEIDNLRHIKKVKKKCDKLMERMKDRQNKELAELEKSFLEDMAELETKYRMELAVICSIHNNSPIGLDKLKSLDNDYAKKREELVSQYSIRRKKMGASHQAERDDLQKRTGRWLEQVKSLTQEELVIDPASEIGGQLAGGECTEPWQHSKGTACVTGESLWSNSDTETSEAKTRVDAITSEVPSLVTDNQRANYQDDATVSLSEAVPTSKEDGSNNLAVEVPLVDLPSAVLLSDTLSGRQCQGLLEHALSSPTSEKAKDTSEIGSVEVDRSIIPDTNQINATCMSLPCGSTTPLPSLTADPSSLGPSPMNQEVGDDSVQRVGNEAEEQMRHVTETPNNVSQSESEWLIRPDSVPLNHVNTEGPGGLSGSQCVVPASVIIPSQDHDHARVPLNGRIDKQLNEVNAQTQGTILPVQQGGNCANTTRESVPQLVQELAVNLAVGASHGQIQTHTSIPTGAVAPHVGRANSIQAPLNSYTVARLPPSLSDPLKNELDRIRKEIEDAINTHDEMKLRLKSECDKEIAEAVAQIRKKFDDKQKEADASHSVKISELQTNEEKVKIHKFLADAFKSKCNDTKAASGMQQVNSYRHIESRSSQLQHATRPSSTAPSPATPPVVSSHATQSTVRAIRPSTALLSGSNPTTRTPQFNANAPTGGPHQVRNAPTQAPPTHIRPQRSAPLHVLPVSYTSMHQPPTLLTQQPPRNTAPSSSSALPNTSQQNQAHQGQSAGLAPSLNLSHSARELLVEISRRNEFNLASSLPQESRDISGFGTAGNAQCPPASSLGADNEVVCLSDDD